MSIDTPNSSAPTLSALDSAITLALEVGVSVTTVTYTWAALEPQPGVIDLSPLKSLLSYYHSHGLRCFIGIQVINTVQRAVPADLVATDFSDPQMAMRFHALLDQLRPVLTSEDEYLSIGNEVDVYLSQHPAEWSSYQSFFNDAVSYAHGSLAGVHVGVTTTYGGYSGSSSSQVKALNTNSDVIMLTYYPVDLNYQVGSATAPATDLPRMISLAAGKPVVIQEAGLPSSTTNGSSEPLQAQFVTSLLQTWRASGRQVPFLTYFQLYDFDATTCANLSSYYADSSPAFVAYLCSLGLRRADGTPKAGWQNFAAD